MTQKIRVLVVDDSKLIRDVLTAILNEQPDIEVVGAAADAFQARDMIKELNPDVITLDVEMPRMNGLEFLDKLMRARPTPVVMISTATERGSEVTFRRAGAGRRGLRHQAQARRSRRPTTTATSSRRRCARRRPRASRCPSAWRSRTPRST
jgi:chemotaxis response regulator CheB